MTEQNQYFPESVPFPGETLAEKLNEIRLSPKEFAIIIGKPEKLVINILNGTAAITPDLAVLFESILQIPAHFWLNKQQRYDEFIEKKIKVELTHARAELNSKLSIRIKLRLLQIKYKIQDFLK